MIEQNRDEAQPVQPLAGLRRRWRGLAVAGSIALVGALVLVALQRPAGQDSRFAVVDQAAVPATTASDPLMAELIHCRSLPPQTDDPACRNAWEENRRRFFGEGRAMRVPGDRLPAYTPIPAPAKMER